YLRAVGLDAIAAHEDALLQQATERLKRIHGVRILGNAVNKAAVLSFLVTDPPMTPLDVGTKLDLDGIAVRTGHHCCMPLMDRFAIPGTVRASFALYNTATEIDVCADALESLLESARKARSLPVEQERCPGQTALCGATGQTCPPKMELQYAPAMGDTPA